jgi:hypothetical protein
MAGEIGNMYIEHVRCSIVRRPDGIVPALVDLAKIGREDTDTPPDEHFGQVFLRDARVEPGSADLAAYIGSTSRSSHGD